MSSDIAILVRGPSLHVEKIKEIFNGFNLVFSTWTEDQSKYTENDIVLFSDRPENPGPGNFNYQKVVVLNGLKFCKLLGFERVLQIRSDMYLTNPKKFLELIDNEVFNFLSWHYHCTSHGYDGYLVDYLMSGKVDDMINLWTIDNLSWHSVSEVFLTDSYSKKISHIPIKFFLNDLNEDNDVFWIKHNLKLSTYKINDFLKPNHDYSYLYLKEHYLNNRYGTIY